MLYRYITLSSSGKTSGIFTAGFDYELMSKRLGLTLQECQELDSHEWLSVPDYSSVPENGEFWFTEEGNKKFKRESLDVIIARLHKGLAVYCIQKELNESDIIVYKDKYQLCIC